MYTGLLSGSISYTIAIENGGFHFITNVLLHQKKKSITKTNKIRMQTRAWRASAFQNSLSKLRHAGGKSILYTFAFIHQFAVFSVIHVRSSLPLRMDVYIAFSQVWVFFSVVYFCVHHEYRRPYIQYTY